MSDPRISQSLRPRRFRIVVGLDLSEYSEVVLEHALDQAARHECPELHIVTVAERRRPDVAALKQALWERTYPVLEAFNRHGRDWRARLHVRRGKVDVELAQLAAETRAALIVIGMFGVHGGSSRNNLPNRIMQQATCPTLVVGLSATVDSDQCSGCVDAREHSDGAQWFCSDHSDSGRGAEMTPMTVWTGGLYTIDRAA
jgi:nucleotide-binding universal stress UspA family protein